MIRALFFFILITTFAAFSAAQKDARSPVEINEGGFRVKFLGKPERSSHVVDTWYGKGEVVVYMYRTDDLIYRFSIGETRSKLLNDDDFNTRLDEAEKGEVQQWGVPVLSQKRGEFMGFRGREAVLEGSSVSLVSRGLFVETKFVYMTVFVRGKLSAMDSADAAAARKKIDVFLNSFTYSKPK